MCKTAATKPYSNHIEKRTVRQRNGKINIHRIQVKDAILIWLLSNFEIDSINETVFHENLVISNIK